MSRLELLDTKGTRKNLIVRGSTVLNEHVLKKWIQYTLGIGYTKVTITFLDSENQARTLPAGKNRIRIGTGGYTDFCEATDEELNMNLLYIETLDLLGG